MAEETMTATVDTGVAPVTETPSSAPAVAETPVSTPTEFTAPTRQANEDDDVYARRYADERAKYDAGQTAKPESPKKEETQPDQKTEEGKHTEPEKKDEPQGEPDPEVGDPLDVELITAKDLAGKLKENPALAEELDKAGLKGVFFESARRSARLSKFEEIYPDPETAQYAKEAAGNFGELDNLITDVPAKGREGVDALMNWMWNADVKIGPDGKPVMGADGNPETNGNVASFVSEFANMVWEQRFPAYMVGLENQAKEALKANPDDDKANEIIAALDILKGAKLGSATQELPPQLKAERDRIEAEKKDLARTKEETRNAEVQQWENTVLTDSEKQLRDEIGTLLGRTALDQKQHGLITNEIYDAIVEQLATDKTFLAKRDWIMRAPVSDSVAKQRVTHNVTSMKHLLYGVPGKKDGIIHKVLDKYGIAFLNQKAARKATIDAQVQASRTEPKGALKVASPAPQKSNADIAAEARKNLIAKGIEPEGADLLREMARLRG